MTTPPRITPTRLPRPEQFAAPADPKLTEAACAALLGCKPGTMRAWRAKDKANEGRVGYVRKSPPHTMEGRHPMYLQSAVRAWLANLPRDAENMPVMPDNRVKVQRMHAMKKATSTR